MQAHRVGQQARWIVVAAAVVGGGCGSSASGTTEPDAGHPQPTCKGSACKDAAAPSDSGKKSHTDASAGDAGRRESSVGDGGKDSSAKTDAPSDATPAHDASADAPASLDAAPPSPTTIAGNQDQPFAIVTDSAGHIFWTTLGDGTNGTVLQASPFAGHAPTTLATGLANPFFLATDGANVYWSAVTASSGTASIFSRPIAGGATTTLVSNEDVDGLAVDDTWVYWPTGSFNTIRRTGKAVGTLTLQTLVPSSSGAVTNPSGIAVDGAYLYWTNKVATTGSVYKLPLVNISSTSATPTLPTPPQVIATQQDAPYQLAIDADYVYWVNTVASGAVVAASKTANVAQALAMDQNMPFGLVSDSVHVFWVNSGDGTVRSLPAGIGSATPTTIAIGQSNPVRVAVTGSAVFWTDDVATGSVMRTSTP